MMGYYHSIETMGTHDGRGIRFVLFLQGCQMQCKFCHNPDTWKSGGKKISAKEVAKQVLDYRPYYEATGGGITLSGGEPLCQADFVTEVFRLCKQKGIHTTLDTSGYGSQQGLEKILASTDQVLFSIKVVSLKKHRWLTGVSNELIIENLKTVMDVMGVVVLRYVIIPEINDGEKEIDQLLELINSLRGEVRLQLLPYHRGGIFKWNNMGKKYEFEQIKEPSQERMKMLRRFFRKSCTLL